MQLRLAVFADCPLMPSAREAAQTPSNCCSSRCQAAEVGVRIQTRACIQLYAMLAWCASWNSHPSRAPAAVAGFRWGPGEGERARLLWTGPAIGELDTVTNTWVCRKLLGSGYVLTSFCSVLSTSAQAKVWPPTELSIFLFIHWRTHAQFLPQPLSKEHIFPLWALPDTQVCFDSRCLAFPSSQVNVILGPDKPRTPAQICILWVTIISDS